MKYTDIAVDKYEVYRHLPKRNKEHHKTQQLQIRGYRGEIRNWDLPNTKQQCY
jgi:hypothetical protein